MAFFKKLIPSILSPKSDDLLRSNRTKIIHIEFTSHCNLRCAFCNVSQPGYKGYQIKKETVEHIIDSIRNRHPKVICVNGHGETTIYKDWHLYCRRMLDMGYDLQIISNFAKKFNDDELRTFSRFKCIEISCDTTDPSLFRELRRGGELSVIMENLKRLQAISAKKSGRKVEISFSCVVSDQTVFGLKDLAAFGKSLGVENFNFCNLVKYPQLADTIPFDHVTEMSLEEMERARTTIHETFRFLKESKIKYSFQQGLLDSLEEKIASLQQPISSEPEMQEKGEAKAGDSPPEASPSHPVRYSGTIHNTETRDCLDPWSFVLVQADGDIRPCCWHHPYTYKKKGITQFNDFINGNLIRELRLGLLTGNLPPECRDCPSRGLTTIDDLRKKVIRYLYFGAHFLVRKYKKNLFSELEETEIEYLSGWYDTEHNPDSELQDWRTWRWTKEKAEFRFPSPGPHASLIIRGMSDQIKLPGQQIVIRVNGNELDRFVPSQYNFIREYLLDPGILENNKKNTGEIEVDRSFIPAEMIPGSDDQRTLGIQIFRLSVVM